MLTEPVDVGVVGELGPKADVLLLENQRNVTGIEENFAIVTALYSK